MSELYLILRRRLDLVKDWVPIETAILREARLRLGMSYETVARKLPVSSKTYERYEKAGRVPRESLPRLAEVLELEISQPTRAPLRFTESPRDVGTEIIDRLDRLEKFLRAKLA
jgi:transcriptional regulator with XRE-family HTH domain